MEMYMSGSTKHARQNANKLKINMKKIWSAGMMKNYIQNRHVMSQGTLLHANNKLL